MRFAIALSLALATAASAGAVVKITSNEPARVQVDGEDLGVTPITLRDMKPGNYEIKLENVRTGMMQSYAIKSPKAGTVEREVVAKWASDEPAQAAVVQPVVVQPVVAQQPVVVQPVAVAPAAVAPAAIQQPELAAPPAPADGLGGVLGVPNLKTKARNVLLGAAVANEVFNKNKKSKTTVRKTAVGLGLLNEAINK